MLSIADNVAGPAITGPDNQSYQYTPANPYQGRQISMIRVRRKMKVLAERHLADVAMYWNRDLRDDLDNLVPTTRWAGVLAASG